MVNVLHDHRQSILDACAPTGVQTFTYVPAVFTPPALIVLPASPYIERASTFCEVVVRHQVAVVLPNGANQEITEQTDSLVWDVFTALLSSGFSVEDVGTFYVYQSGQSEFLACDVTVTAPVPLPS